MDVRCAGEALYIACQMEKRAIRLYERALAVFADGACQDAVRAILAEERNHLNQFSRMGAETPDFERAQLLSASSSGKNEAARGLMGRLRNFFEQGDGVGVLPYYMSEMDDPASASLHWEWSLNAYQTSLQEYAEKDEKAREIWDELEKSVVTHVADEIKIYIRGGIVEMTIIEKLG